jgi:hypothetical protein
MTPPPAVARLVVTNQEKPWPGRERRPIRAGSSSPSRTSARSKRTRRAADGDQKARRRSP